MADGFNDARVLRVSEIMNQYRETQGQISQYQVQAPQGSAQEMGFQILQECRVEARALLNKAYRLELLHPPSSPMEESKRQLQRVIIDASARRFQAQKFYLRATAAMRWIHSRNALIQQSQKSQSSSAAKPKPLDAILNGELASITDTKIFNGFRAVDEEVGYWLVDDPTLPAILEWIRTLG